MNQVQNVYIDFGQQTHSYQEHGGLVNTSTTPKVQYSYVRGATNAIRTHTTITSGTFQQQWELHFVGWTFLSVDGVVIDCAFEDSQISDKNVQATVNMIGIPNPPATTTGSTAVWNQFTGSGTPWNPGVVSHLFPATNENRPGVDFNARY